MFPAEILRHCYKFGEGILRKSTVQLYPRVHFAIVQPTANSVVKVQVGIVTVFVLKVEGASAIIRRPSDGVH